MGEQAIEEQSVRMPPPAPPTAEGIVREATSILRKATVSQEGELADAGLGVAVTAHLADVMQESAPKKAVAKSANAEELTTDDLSALREAIDALSQEKGQSFIGEHDVLSDIKQELVDYEEDLGELKDITESTGRKQLQQTKGAARLYKKVNRIMGRMDTVVAKLKTRESKLTENMDMLHKSEAHEGHLVTVQDLLGAVQGLQKVPDSSRLERISEVIASMDEDSDGIVKVEHVQKVIEILGRDNVQLSAKQVKQIIDLIGKEEMLEVENKIEKILGKMPAFEEELVAVPEAVKEQAIKSDGGVEKDLTEGAGENVIEDMAVEMNEEKMEQHIAELFSRPDIKKEELKASASAEALTLENGQILSRPPRDTSVKDVTEKVAEEAVSVEEEVKGEKDQQQEEQELEKIPQTNGSSKH